MNLDPDLQRILNVGAKIYHTKDKLQGKVYSVDDIEVMIDYGKGKYATHNRGEFEQLLTSDVIVANSRVTLGNGENFKIKPREKSALTQAFDVILGDKPEYMKDVHPPKPFNPGPQPGLTNRQPAEVGYINFSTGKFSTEPKKGYTKVEYRKSVEKVTLEVDSEMLQRLRDMGLLK